MPVKESGFVWPRDGWMRWLERPHLRTPAVSMQVLRGDVAYGEVEFVSSILDLMEEVVVTHLK